MGSVTDISPQVELGKFFDFIYGNQRGYAYSATKNPDPDNPVFKQYFFEWPQQREQLVNHVLQKTATHEVYYGPAIFSQKDATKDSFKGANVVWVEFDGNSPASLEDVPQPTLKIQSSTSQHEHWYWKLDEFVTDISVLEGISRRLTYHLGADLGSWDATQVLRPPGTLHHESQRTTQVLRWDPIPHAKHSFNHIPDVPIDLIDEKDIKHIPDPLDVLIKFHWDPDFLGLFRGKVYSKADYEKLTPEQKAQPNVGKDRNAALAKLAHFCFEAEGKDGTRIKNSEVLSILWNADERWGKFRGRKDRKQRLIAIINSIRAKHPVDLIKEEAQPARFRVYTYDEFINTEINLEWVIPNLLHRKGMAFLTGPSDIGKSQLSIRFAEKLAKGEKFLQWQPEHPMKTLMVSMEMPHEELHHVMKQMRFDDKDGMLRENMLIMPLGYSVKLGDLKSQAELAAVIEDYQPDGVIFDSFGMGLSDDLNSEKIILNMFDYVNKVLKAQYGVFTWFIHHYRKAQVGNKNNYKLEDMFGSAYIHNQITTGIGLRKMGELIQVDCLKLRLAKHFDSFRIKRMPDLDFSIVERGVNTDRGAFGVIEGLGGEAGPSVGLKGMDI